MTRHLLVIGAQRCGTTALQRLLDAHPDIATARPARPEPKVFLSAELAGRGLDWYRSTFFAHATAETLLAEKSTSYLEDAAAARRAARMLGPAVAVVVQLRDPVARAVSNWRFSREHGAERRPLDRALSENLLGPRDWDTAATSVSPFAYLERGHYLDLLQPWLDCFGEAVHVRFLEEVAAGQATPAALYERLGVDPALAAAPDAGRPVNASSGSEPELDAELRQRLRTHFADSDRRLARWLGRDLPWATT
ncbi:sulfotransferase [soil metagenome]